MPGLGTCHNLELSHGNRERQRISHRRRPVWLISVFQEPVATILPAAPLIFLPATRPAITKKFNYGFSSVTAHISSPEKYRAVPRSFPDAKRAPKLNGGVFQHLAAVARLWLIHQPLRMPHNSRWNFHRCIGGGLIMLKELETTTEKPQPFILSLVLNRTKQKPFSEDD